MSGDLWVFGYGSLMWHPGFPFTEAHPARLAGFHRAFCIYSMHYRGTPRRPGLILGLDRGGVCEGVAFRVAPDDAAGVRRYLRERELVTGVYREALLPLSLSLAAPSSEPAHAEIWAMTYIAERMHPAYAGDLPLAVQARLVRKAKGLTGYNLDYVLNTELRLRELGIRERKIERLVGLLGPHLGHGEAAEARAARRRAMAESANDRPLRIAAGRLTPGARRRFTFRRVLATHRGDG